MDAAPGSRKDPEIVFTHLMEGIGLAFDLKGERMFITDLAGSVYSANLDGSNRKTLLFAARATSPALLTSKSPLAINRQKEN